MSTVPFSCRGCDSTRTTVLLDMGRLPLANAFVTSPDDRGDEFTETLRLTMCEDCSLIQIRDEVPREALFSSYLWTTGTSSSAASHARWFTARLVERYRRDRPLPFLVEVASNDGFFLEHYQRAGFNVLGVDPSNLAEEASQRGLPSVRAFFGRDVATQICREHGPADLIVARNVLGHASALQDLVAGFKTLLARDGVLIIEVPYGHFLRADVQYDTVFHEHLSYPIVTAVSNLLARFSMKITDISFVRMNGGSMLCEVVHDDSVRVRNDQALLDFETLTELNSPAGWRRFARAVEAQRAALRALLEKLSAEGAKVVAYGAAGKFMTMLNYCSVTRDLIAAVGDANPRKQGLLCPGVRIPVVTPAELMKMNPDYVLIGAWNLKDEIIKLFRNDLGYHNRFIVPLPMPEIEE